MARPPHEEHEHRERVYRELEALEAQQVAKYGVPYEKLPEVLRYPPPEHPQRSTSRRFDDISMRRVWRHRTLRLASRTSFGWRTQRQQYLAKLEQIRRAEIAVRKLRTKHTGRGKPLDRKAHVHARERIEAREWRDDF
jgi:hypothetical protein